MTELFMKLLNMSINAGWLVLTVLLVRIIFRKAPQMAVPRIVELCVDSASHAKRIGKSLECHS